jgi:hypothetical protein
MEEAPPMRIEKPSCARFAGNKKKRSVERIAGRDFPPSL